VPLSIENAVASAAEVSLFRTVHIFLVEAVPFPVMPSCDVVPATPFLDG
jgi:hypothetical protein